MSASPTRYAYEGPQWYSRHIGVRYPSPFFDVAQQYLPSTIHEMLRWCSYYFLTNPIINVAVTKMAEYPVTDMIYEDPDPQVRARYAELEEVLRLRAFQVEIGLDYHAYGNCFVSIYYPFIRFLVCRNCQRQTLTGPANRSRYRWRDMRFVLSCPHCNTTSPAKIHDQVVRKVSDIRLIRWNPEQIDIKHSSETGHSRYYYRLPRATLTDIALGDYDVVEKMPQTFLDAARERRSVIFSPTGIYHLKRPTLAQKDMGWGTPMILPLLKHTYYMQVMQKAQETLYSEYVVPMRSIYPGPPSGAGMDNPFGTYNLSNWKAQVQGEINNWRRDPNYIPIFPMNVGFQQWGGTGKALVLHHEMRLLAEHILAGAGIPVEFVFGGLQWSGTNTSVRALANAFQEYNSHRKTLVMDFILGNIANFLGWDRPRARFKPFEMPDNLQRAMYLHQLAQGNKISSQTLLEEVGLDPGREQERMRAELPNEQATMRRTQVAAAAIQGEAGVVSARFQARAAKLQGTAQMEMQMEQQAAMQQQQAGAQPPPQDGPMPALPQATAPPLSIDSLGTPPPPGDQGGGSQPETMTRLPLPLASLVSRLSLGQQAGPDITTVARSQASRIRALSPDEQQDALAALSAAQPEVGKLTRGILDSNKGSQVNPMNAMQNPRPNGTGPGTDPSRAVG